MSDGLNNVTTHSFDRLLRLVSTTDADQNTVLRTYDLADNLKTLRDANNNVTTWNYDNLDRLQSETNELQKTREFAYDSVGNLRRYKDRDNRVTVTNYDNLYRPVSEFWGSEEKFRFSFDLVGNVTLKDAIGAAKYDLEYDDFYRNDSVTQDVSRTDGTDVHLAYSYDKISNVTKAIAAPNSSRTQAFYVNSYKYDDVYQLSEVSQSGQGSDYAVASKIVNFRYDAAGQRTRVNRGNGFGFDDVTTFFDWDVVGRLKTITHIDPTSSNLSSTNNFVYHWSGGSGQIDGLIAAYGIDYDAANRIEYFDSFADGLRVAYSYDNRNQLISQKYFTLGASSTPHPSLAMKADQILSFDDNGNRKLLEGNSLSPDGQNNRISNDGSFSYEYDDEGNVKKRTSIPNGSYREFVWDFRNRLSAVTDFSSTNAVLNKITYIYDADNRLIGRTADVAGDGVGVLYNQYVQDRGQISLAFQNSQLTNRYLWAVNVDELLADEVITDNQLIGQTRWALTDHLGSVRDLVNANSAVVDHAVYDAYGKVIDSPLKVGDAAIDSVFGFTGRLFDDETGLQNNHHRWYDPVTGRWQSEDPIGFAAGDANLYRYVGNQATTKLDPSGLETTIMNGVAVTVTRDGHHVIPVSLWDVFGFDPTVADILDRARIDTAEQHLFDDPHIEYNYAITADLNCELGKYIDSNGKNGVLTPLQQRNFIEKYIQRVMPNGNGPRFLREFNDRVRYPAKLATWWNNTGQFMDDIPTTNGGTLWRRLGLGGKVLLYGGPIGVALGVPGNVQAASAGYRGEGRFKGGGAVGAYVEVCKESFEAETVESGFRSWGQFWADLIGYRYGQSEKSRQINEAIRNIR